MRSVSSTIVAQQQLQLQQGVIMKATTGPQDLDFRR